jgi:hypothetical protein
VESGGERRAGVDDDVEGGIDVGVVELVLLVD